MIRKNRRNRIRTTETRERNGCLWLTTFNDMITLLMVFFVLLFAVGQINSQVSGQFLHSLQSALGVLEEGKRLAVGGSAPANSPEPAETVGEGMEQADPDPDKKIIHHPDVSVVQTAQKLYITVADRILFRSGSAELNPNGYPVLDQVGGMLQGLKGQIRIEGHTDHMPIQNNRFPSNWELSVARAVHVLNYFIQVQKMDPGRFSVAGYGESRPIHPNDSPEHREKNRRVNIVMEMETTR